MNKVLLPCLLGLAGAGTLEAATDMGMPQRTPYRPRPIEVQPSASPAPVSPARRIPRITATDYLPVVGPPPLRFRPAPLPFDLAYESPRDFPPPPAPDEAPQPPIASLEKPVAAAPETPPPEPLVLEAVDPLPILPDETPRRVRPEDVLPFFIFPGAPVSAPAQLPSSATYRQQ